MAIIEDVKNKINSVINDNNLDTIAQQTKFIVRKRKINAAKFLENSLLLLLSGVNNSLNGLACEFYQNGCAISKQALHKKTTRHSAVLFLREVLNQLLTASTIKTQLNLEDIPFISQIKAVDSSIISFHQLLKEIFPYRKNQGAAVKLQAMIEMTYNNPLFFEVVDAKAADQGYTRHVSYIKKNELLLGDLGYFCIANFEQIQANKGFFLSRYFKKTNLYYPDQQLINLSCLLSQSQEKAVDISILLGQKQFPCRLVAIRLNKAAYRSRLTHLKKERLRDPRLKKKKDSLNKWTIFVTNLPDTVSAQTLLKIYSLRWQIELLFKTMKTFLNLRKIASTNQYTSLMSVYLSLIATVILSLVSTSITDQEISLYKAGNCFVRNIRTFIDQMRQNVKKAVSWLRIMLRRFALKESRASRFSTKQQLSWRTANA